MNHRRNLAVAKDRVDNCCTLYIQNALIGSTLQFYYSQENKLEYKEIPQIPIEPTKNLVKIEFWGCLGVYTSYGNMVIFYRF